MGSFGIVHWIALATVMLMIVGGAIGAVVVAITVSRKGP